MTRGFTCSRRNRWLYGTDLHLISFHFMSRITESSRDHRNPGGGGSLVHFPFCSSPDHFKMDLETLCLDLVRTVPHPKIHFVTIRITYCSACDQSPRARKGSRLSQRCVLWGHTVHRPHCVSVTFFLRSRFHPCCQPGRVHRSSGESACPYIPGHPLSLWALIAPETDVR